MQSELIHKVFTVTPDDFEDTCIEVFRYQHAYNPLYQRYVNALGIDVQAVQHIHQIPFLPISFFKTHEVKTGAFHEALLFESSGTTGTAASRHFVRSSAIYRKSFRESFRIFYGRPEDYCIIGLLPSYLERKHSSLVYMVNDLIECSGHAHSGFYLYDEQGLLQALEQLEKKKQLTLLIGVTFALMDFAEHHTLPLQHTIVMETGGMKGRKTEITRAEVHEFLRQRLGLKTVHAEYGMTELLSQAYSSGNGLFTSPPWMKVVLREEDDPLRVITQPDQATAGAINVIDLANIHSCSFIATDDLGRLYPDGSFEVLGRIDATDIRGCSLLVAPA